MNENFKISPDEINKIKLLNQKDKNFRLENLKLFNQQGFPTRNQEDWKFSDINQIFSKNFKNLVSFKNEIKPKSINFIKEFDHNHILMVNGKLENSEFKFEDKNKIKIKSYNDSNFSLNNEENSLINLNNALSNNGLFLEVADNYRIEKAIIIYNVFTDDLKDNLLRPYLSIDENLIRINSRIIDSKIIDDISIESFPGLKIIIVGSSDFDSLDLSSARINSKVP